ncbi:MAG: hypothetical protein A3G76_07965 [Acidobacteria bacterium RIFCSPLOWO2_12_FULL_65_11]|nr:MAG: hypothetical protein A3H95_11670 [Acidobacteria bacterium RIFCSPLOWO2_02_FULL_64_15]OFW31159.1 MAG: hypothetical protein A3G76_07965 [Acidobacteria bacterium RIFCSPLOWO2_12_FULL_65_11]
MRRFCLSLSLAAILLAHASGVSAQPAFVNGLVIRGSALDATGQPGANGGRLGVFSDLYYDPVRGEWWAVSDRGPGGGTLPYETRLNRVTLDVNPWTGRISNFRVKETMKFTDPQGLLSASSGPKALNGLNPALLNGDAGILGRSFDPEGLAIDPRTGHFIVTNEYGPSLYVFDRKGRLLRVFETPANLIPKVGAVADYVAGRDQGLTAGRQDNRGYEGLAVTPDGKKLYAVLQDPLIEEPGPNNGRNGRNLRIVVFDNDRHSATYGTSIAQYAYQLELQADVRARILAAGGASTATDPRQGRNLGLSAIAAINDHQFLVLERDNRGIGVDDPAGANVVGTKRIYKIDIDAVDTTDISGLVLPDNGNLAGAGITPVSKSLVFSDLALDTMLPNGKQVEKWEGMTIEARTATTIAPIGTINFDPLTRVRRGFATTGTYHPSRGWFRAAARVEASSGSL